MGWNVSLNLLIHKLMLRSITIETAFLVFNNENFIPA